MRIIPALLAILLVPVPAPAGTPPGDAVREVVIAAWQGPELEAALARLDADLADVRLAAHPGAPYAELAREGIDSGFNTAPNAAWYLRVGAPINSPWGGKSVRNALGAVDRHTEALRRVAALDVAGRAVSAWLDLAAAESRLAVRESQLRRIEEALVLQRKRLELGEVSGAEVTQLELERLRLVGGTGSLRAGRAEAEQTLLRYSGRSSPRPATEDLTLLHAGLEPVDWSGDQIEAWVDRSPRMSALGLGSERARLQGIQARRTALGPTELELEWERIPGIDGFPAFDAVGFRVAVPLPVGGLARRTAHRAEANLRKAEVDSKRVRRELTASILAGIERTRAAERSNDALGGFEPDLAGVERSLVDRYRLGVLPYLEYINGLSRLDDVRIQAIEARYAGLQARLELAIWTGDNRFFPLPSQETAP